MRRPRGILFDLGGTILSEDRFDLLGGLAAVRPGAPLNEAKALWDRQLKFRANALVECTFSSYLRLALGPGPDLEALELPFWQAAVTMHPEPGVVACLERLSHFGMPLGIVSNSIFAGPTLDWEMERNGVRKPFAFVMASSDYGIRKPDPWIFEVAARRLGLPAEELVYVGDSLQYDVEGARRAGMTPLWYAPQAQEVAPGLDRLRHWDELERLLGESL